MWRKIERLKKDRGWDTCVGRARRWWCLYENCNLNYPETLLDFLQTLSRYRITLPNYHELGGVVCSDYPHQDVFEAFASLRKSNPFQKEFSEAEITSAINLLDASQGDESALPRASSASANQAHLWAEIEQLKIASFFDSADHQSKEWWVAFENQNHNLPEQIAALLRLMRKLNYSIQGLFTVYSHSNAKSRSELIEYLWHVRLYVPVEYQPNSAECKMYCARWDEIKDLELSDNEEHWSRIEKMKSDCRYEEVDPEARRWWNIFESCHLHDPGVVERLLTDLVARESTIAQLMDVFLNYDTPKIKDNLKMLDFKKSVGSINTPLTETKCKTLARWMERGVKISLFR